MKQYIINQDVVNALRLYLQTKPYVEVVEGINALNQLEPYTLTTPRPPLEIDEDEIDLHNA